MLNTHNKQWLLIYSAQFISTFSMMLIVAIMPLYMMKLTHQDIVAYETMGSVALAIALPAVSTLLVAPFWGRGMDKYPVNTVFNVSLLVFISSLLLMGASDSLTFFLIGRFLLGCSGNSVILFLMAKSFTPIDNHGKMIGRIQSSQALGCLLGPIIGGLFFDYTRCLFLSCALLLACVSLLSFIVFDRSKDPELPTTISSLTISNTPNLTGYCWLTAGLFVQIGAFSLVVIFSLLVDRFNMSVYSTSFITGLLHALSWGATFFFAFFCGRFNDKGYSYYQFFIASFLSGLLVIGFVNSTSLAPIFLSRIMQGLCFAALAQTVTFTLLRLSSSDNSGVVLGLTQSVMNAGQLIGPFLLPLAGLYCIFIQDGDVIDTALAFTGASFIVAGTVACLGWFFELQRVTRERSPFK